MEQEDSLISMDIERSLNGSKLPSVQDLQVDRKVLLLLGAPVDTIKYPTVPYLALLEPKARIVPQLQREKIIPGKTGNAWSLEIALEVDGQEIDLYEKRSGKYPLTLFCHCKQEFPIVERFHGIDPQCVVVFNIPPKNLGVRDDLKLKFKLTNQEHSKVYQGYIQVEFRSQKRGPGAGSHEARKKVTKKNLPKLNLVSNTGSVNGLERVNLELSFPLMRRDIKFDTKGLAVLWDGKCIECALDSDGENLFVMTPPHPPGFVEVFLALNGEVVTEKTDYLYVSNVEALKQVVLADPIGNTLVVSEQDFYGYSGETAALEPLPFVDLSADHPAEQTVYVAFTCAETAAKVFQFRSDRATNLREIPLMTTKELLSNASMFGTILAFLDSPQLVRVAGVSKDWCKTAFLCIMNRALDLVVSQSDAEQELKYASKACPIHYAPYYYLAQELETKASKFFLHRALKESPTESIRWTMQSLIETSTVNQLKAINKALEFDSNFAEAWCHKGNIMLRNGSFSEAKECYTHCCNLPYVKQYEAYFNRGIAEIQLNNKTQAFQDFAQSFYSNVHFVCPLEQLKESSKLVEVEKYLETQIRENAAPHRYWSLSSAYFAIGLCRIHQGDLVSAIDFLNTALDHGYNRTSIEEQIRECWEKLPKSSGEGPKTPLESEIENALDISEIYFEMEEEEDKETLLRTFWIGPGNIEEVKDIVPISPELENIFYGEIRMPEKEYYSLINVLANNRDLSAAFPWIGKYIVRLKMLPDHIEIRAVVWGSI